MKHEPPELPTTCWRCEPHVNMAIRYLCDIHLVSLHQEMSAYMCTNEFKIKQVEEKIDGVASINYPYTKSGVLFDILLVTEMKKRKLVV